MRWTHLILCVLLAMPAAIWAQPRKGSEKPERRPGERSGHFTPWTEEDWTKFRNFCAEHSKNRWEDIKARNAGDRSRLGGMVMQFRFLQGLKEGNEPLYQIKVRQIEVEDGEYGKLKEIRKEADPARKQKLEAELRKLNREYIDLRLAEKEQRIRWLELRLKLEMKNVEDDRKATDQLTDKRLAELLREGPDYFLAPKPPHRDGESGPSTGAGLPAGPVTGAP